MTVHLSSKGPGKNQTKTQKNADSNHLNQILISGFQNSYSWTEYFKTNMAHTTQYKLYWRCHLSISLWRMPTISIYKRLPNPTFRAIGSFGLLEYSGDVCHNLSRSRRTPYVSRPFTQLGGFDLLPIEAIGCKRSPSHTIIIQH